MGNIMETIAFVRPNIHSELCIISGMEISEKLELYPLANEPAPWMTRSEQVSVSFGVLCTAQEISRFNLLEFCPADNFVVTGNLTANVCFLYSKLHKITIDLADIPKELLELLRERNSFFEKEKLIDTSRVNIDTHAFFSILNPKF